MTLQQNEDRIRTTHIGSLPRPHALLDLTKRKYGGENYDDDEYQRVLRIAVKECVRKQVACGIDVVTDGEFSKLGFFTYIRERIVEPLIRYAKFKAMRQGADLATKQLWQHGTRAIES